MEIMEGIRTALKELIVPELDKIKEENREIRAILEVTNKRLDDVNTHLADQSRRIDSVREELGQRIGSVREELSGDIKGTNDRIDSLRERLSGDIKGTNDRIDRLYEVIVRRDEHQQVVLRLMDLEREVREIKRQLAA